MHSRLVGGSSLLPRSERGSCAVEVWRVGAGGRDAWRGHGGLRRLRAGGVLQLGGAPAGCPATAVPRQALLGEVVAGSGGGGTPAASNDREGEREGGVEVGEGGNRNRRRPPLTPGGGNWETRIRGRTACDARIPHRRTSLGEGQLAPAHRCSSVASRRLLLLPNRNAMSSHRCRHRRGARHRRVRQRRHGHGVPRQRHRLRLRLSPRSSCSRRHRLSYADAQRRGLEVGVLRRSVSS